MHCTECQMITYLLFERSVEKRRREISANETRSTIGRENEELLQGLKPSEVLLCNVGAEAPTP
jgi:hypothetical protein